MNLLLPIFFKAVVVIKTLTRSHTEVQKRENRVSVWHSELPVAAFNVYLAPLVWNVICGEHGFSRWVSLRFECINMFGAKTEVRNGKLWNQKWSLTIDWNQPRVNYMESVKLLSINNSQHFKPYLKTEWNKLKLNNCATSRYMMHPQMPQAQLDRLHRFLRFAKTRHKSN